MGQTQQFRGENSFWERPALQKSTVRGANITSAGVHNREIALHVIRSRGVITRAELAELTGLTTPAVFKIAKDLLAEDLILVSPTDEKARGRPTRALCINPDAAFAVGLNIDRDHLTMVVVDYVGRVRHRFYSRTEFAAPEEVRTFVARNLDSLKASDLALVRKICGIGVAIPDDLGLTHLPGQPARYMEWNSVRCSELFRGLLDVPIIQENDAASAAIGEMSFGSGLKLESFFYVFFSAGLGGGLVINRRYVRGAHGRSGELGFLPQINPLRSSQTNLQKTLGDAVLVSDLLKELRELGFGNVSVANLHELVGAETVIQGWVRRIADYLYLPLLTVMATVDPDAILVGGDLPPSIIQAICFQISKRLSMHVGMNWPQMAVRAATVNNDPSAVGSAVLAFQRKWEANLTNGCT